VGQVVPELAAPEVLSGFDEDGSVLDGDSHLMESPLLTIFLLGKPIVYRTEKKLTLRHLLTHTSGFTFSLISQNLQKWAAYHGRNIDHTQGTYVLRSLSANFADKRSDQGRLVGVNNLPTYLRAGRGLEIRARSRLGRASGRSLTATGFSTASNQGPCRSKSSPGRDSRNLLMRISAAH
jgi:hypothetical protein